MDNIFSMGKPAEDGRQASIGIFLIADVDPKNDKAQARRQLGRDARRLATLIVDNADLDFSKALIKALEQTVEARAPRNRGSHRR